MKLIAMFCMFLRRIDRLCVSVDVDVDVTSIAFVFYENEVLPHLMEVSCLLVGGI